MPFNFAALFLSPKFWLAAGGIALCLAVFVQTKRLDHAKGDLKEARAALIDPVSGKKWPDIARAAQRDLGTCRGNEATLQGALDSQSARVDALAAAGRKATARAAAAVQRARSASQRASRTAAEILATKAGADQCASADAVILASLRGPQ